ncbi:GTP cyclohydrolase II [Mycobacterium sp. E1747]|uniref:GTP cyclohydrolase II n=1 Tax=Mycobacterium sp. E1747 TaxID=1834128 RepID=UPI0007FF7F71|nr:GTP cyclohydrolase II [Mycobacterium sp. E1747]
MTSRTDELADIEDGDRETLVVHSESMIVTTDIGEFTAIWFTVSADPTVHIALVRGDVTGGDVLTRVHSECLTGDVFGSRRCDCGEQLGAAMSAVVRARRGVIIYLRGHEGRGIGLINKLRAYALQEGGLDTVQANVALGLPVDARSYEAAVAILRYLDVRSVALLTNNPEKVVGLRQAGILCTTMVPMPAAETEDNRDYLTTKADRMGHRGLIPR